MEGKSEEILISVSRELADHYQAVKKVCEEAILDPEASFSQKASVINATTALLKDLGKLQTDLFNSTTIALLTQEIINGLADASFELKQKVVQALQEKLENFS